MTEIATVKKIDRESPITNLFLPAAPYWLYAGVVLCTLLYGLVGVWGPNGDVVAYYDLAGFILHGQWHSVVNAYWFPLYPALIAVARLVLGTSPAHEQMAGRLVSAAIDVFFVLASAFLADSLQKLLARDGVNDLLRPDTLHLWVVTFASFFSLQYLTIVSPDALLSSLLVLAVALLVRAALTGRLLLHAAAGIVAGLAYLTKTFALPFFVLSVILLAVAYLRRPRILLGMAISLATFAGLALPWIALISKSEGHFTYGDSGRLVPAWYVNHADRFNPVNDAAVFRAGDARMNLTHPGVLLFVDPQVVYFDQRIPGTMPQWDNPAYWEDGLRPRFVLRETLVAASHNLVALIRTCDARPEVIALLLAFPVFGFSLRRSSLRPGLIALTAAAVACLAMYLTVLIEPRFVTFPIVMLAVLYAASCSGGENAKAQSLHAAVLLLAGVFILAELHMDVENHRQMQAVGGSLTSGVYDSAIISAGAQLTRLYSPGAQIACMGARACWDDPYWARYARVRMDTTIETGNGATDKGAINEDALIGCQKINAHPQVLHVLQMHEIRAIVARFRDEDPCSAEWKQLGGKGGFYYLPLR